MLVRGAGVVFSHQLPTGSDVSMARAMSIAPFGLIAPAPRRSPSYATPASSWMPTDVYSRTDFTALGVNLGWYWFTDRFASTISAIDPVATAVAMLVPLSSMQSASGALSCG